MIVQQRPVGSALTRAVEPDAQMWGPTEHLLAAVFDVLQIANWQRGEAKRSTFPKPLPRPGVEPDAQLIGAGGGLPMDEMAQRLGWTEGTA